MADVIWDIDEVKPINVITHHNVDLVAFYSFADSDIYTQIPQPFTQDGNRYFLTTSFSVEGDYVIKVIDNNNNFNPVYNYVTVKQVNGILSSEQHEQLMKTATKNDVIVGAML